MKRVIVFLFLLLMVANAQGQKLAENFTFHDGYVLKGMDTVWCKVLFSPAHPHSFSNVSVLIGEERMEFTAGNFINGFGVQDEKGKTYHYGVIEPIVSGIAGHRHKVFAPKVVAGLVDFYEYNLSMTQTNTKRVIGGISSENKTTTSTRTETYYFLARNDSAGRGIPVQIEDLKKKTLAPFIDDNPVLFASIENKLSIKKLITVLEEYNSWAMKNLTDK